MSGAADQAIIEITSLGYAYPDGTEALHCVDCTICPGETVALVGGNGAGKSTLLMLLAGGFAVSTGEVRIGGIRVERNNLETIRLRMGMVFQDSDEQLFMPTVGDDVAFGPLNQGLSDPEVTERVTRALAAVGLTGLSERAPYRLSGGQKRLAAIATVLAMEPEVLLLDEPTSNLDPKARRGLVRLLQGLGRTMVVATHDLPMVNALCGRTVVLDRGRIFADGPTGRVLAEAAVRERLIGEE